nr:acetyltransferase [Vibrio cholerae]
MLCLSFVVMRCQPLRRALCTFSEDRNLWIKILKFGGSTTKRHYLVHIQNALNLQRN